MTDAPCNWRQPSNAIIKLMLPKKVGAQKSAKEIEVRAGLFPF